MKNEETLFLFAKAIKNLIKKQPLDKILFQQQEKPDKHFIDISKINMI